MINKYRLLERLILPLFFMVIPFRLYHLSYPLLDAHNFRQAQTASIVLNFYNKGINLFQTELDVFGIGREKFLTLEFPLYEVFVALLYKIFFVSDIWGRVVSILAGFAGAWYLFKLVLLLVRNKKIAFFSSFFFLFSPLNMFYQRSFMIEPTVIAILLGGIYFFCRWVDSKDVASYLLAIILISLGFVHKIVYGPFWLIPMIVFYLKKRSFRGLFSSRFILLLIIPLAFSYFWQQHINYINTSNGHEYFTSYNRGFMEWNFGNLADRYSVTSWRSYFQQLLNGIFLKPGLLLFIIGLISISKVFNGSFFLSWLISQFIYFLVFFRIQSHNYYQAIMIPVFSVFMAIGLMKIAEFIKIKTGKAVGISFICIFCIGFIYKSWVNTLPSYYVDWGWYTRLKKMGDSMNRGAYAVFATSGYDWNSVYPYITKHKMLVIEAENLSLENIKLWKDSGYSYLILHEYEKYTDYFSKVKPGHTLNFLDTYKSVLNIQEFKVYQI